MIIIERNTFYSHVSFFLSRDTTIQSVVLPLTFLWTFILVSSGVVAWKLLVTSCCTVTSGGECSNAASCEWMSSVVLLVFVLHSYQSPISAWFLNFSPTIRQENSRWYQWIFGLTNPLGNWSSTDLMWLILICNASIERAPLESRLCHHHGKWWTLGRSAENVLSCVCVHGHAGTPPSSQRHT